MSRYPTLFLTAVLIVSASPTRSQSVSLPFGGDLVYSNVNGSTQVLIRGRAGQGHFLRLQRDANVPAGAAPTALTIIGEIPNVAIVLVDKYRSAPRGLGMCKSGEESFLRIIATNRDPPIESMRIKLESCIDSIELASPGIDWQTARSTLTVRWLTGPSLSQRPEELVFRIGAM
jgi:hypothetical protein